MTGAQQRARRRQWTAQHMTRDTGASGAVGEHRTPAPRRDKEGQKGRTWEGETRAADGVLWAAGKCQGARGGSEKAKSPPETADRPLQLSLRV